MTYTDAKGLEPIGERSKLNLFCSIRTKFSIRLKGNDMYSFKKFSVVAMAVYALSVVAVTSASASNFTASATGSLNGKALAWQEFTFNGGTVRCNTAETLGTIVSTASTEQAVSVLYKGCTALGEPADITTAEYVLTANGEVHIKNTITITVTLSFFPDCYFTITPQTVKSVAFSNSGSNLVMSPSVTGIVYETSSTFPPNSCGASGSNGTYTGANEYHRVNGGSISWDL